MLWGTAMARRTSATTAPDPAALALAGVIERHISGNGWSIRDAARQWGMNDSTIGKILNDPARIPRPPTMRKLASGMGLSIQRLYALCGIADSVEVEDADRDLVRAAIYGMTAADLDLLSRMNPEQKAAMLASARALLLD